MNELRVITVDELKEVICKNALWLANEEGGELANLSWADLREADLSGANLRWADLRGADLREADLSGANLRSANLRSANLRSANLRSADLSYADLSDADLRCANLSDADLRDADLSGANLSGANLSGANLSGANLLLIGQDIRGYLFWAFVGESGAVEVRAGCRHFIGLAAARAHWTERHTADPILHEDCLSLVDRCERMATVRGWKLEPES